MAILFGLQIYEPNWPMWRMLSYFALLLHFTVSTTFRLMTFNALQITSDTLVRRFKVINITSVIFVLCSYHTQNLNSQELVLNLLDCGISQFQIVTARNSR